MSLQSIWRFGRAEKKTSPRTTVAGNKKMESIDATNDEDLIFQLVGQIGEEKKITFRHVVWHVEDIEENRQVMYLIHERDMNQAEFLTKKVLSIKSIGDVQKNPFGLYTVFFRNRVERESLEQEIKRKIVEDMKKESVRLQTEWELLRTRIEEYSQEQESNN